MQSKPGLSKVNQVKTVCSVCKKMREKTYPFILVCDSCSIILFCTKHPGVSECSAMWWASTSSRIAALSAFDWFNLSLDKLFDLYLPFIGAKLLSVNALKPFNFVSFRHFSLIILVDISHHKTNSRVRQCELSISAARGPN